MSGSDVDRYKEMKKEQVLTGYRNLAYELNAPRHRGDPDAYDKVRFGQSINPPTKQLTREEKEKKAQAQLLKEYNEINAEYKRRQAAAKEEAAAAAKAEAAAAAAPKSPKSQKSPSKGSNGGSKRNRRNNRNRTYRGRPTRSRSSRRNA